METAEEIAQEHDFFFLNDLQPRLHENYIWWTQLINYVIRPNFPKT